MEPYPSVPLCLPSNFTWDPQNRHIQVDKSKPRGDVTVCKEGLAILEGVKDDYVIVICITGPARTGKSYFLSQFQEGVTFDVGHKTTSKTTGIWIALAPNLVTTTDGKVARLVLLDAEGLGSASTIDHDESTDIWDRKVFTLCALFSSYLIYNSKSIPRNDDLDKLSFMSQFSSSIQGHLSTPGESTQTAVDISPYFMWLIRDADLQPEVDGQNCTWKKYILSDVLCVEAVAAARNHRNAIKAAIRTSFQNFDAHGIPPPRVNPRLIQNLPLADDEEEIGNEFLCQVLEVKNHVLACAEVKSIKGFHVTGQQLALYVSLCVFAVNSECDKLPIQTAWQSLLVAKWNATFIAIMEKYDDLAIQINFPVSTEDIEKFHEKESAEAQKAFTDFEASLFDDRSVKQYRKNLTLGLKEKLHTIMTINNTKSRSSCENVAQNLIHLFTTKVEIHLMCTFEELLASRQTAIAEYERKAKGPSIKEMRKTLEKQLDSEIEKVQSLSNDACEKAMISAKSKHFDPKCHFISQRTTSELKFAKKTVLAEYDRAARGPAKDKVKRKYGEDMDEELRRLKPLIALHEAEIDYKKKLDALLKEGPFDSQEALVKCSSICKIVRENFETKCDGLSSANLDSVESNAVADFNQRNDDLSSEYCNTLMTKLIRKILKPSIDSNEMLVSYDKKKSSILQQYNKKAKGPKADEVKAAAVLQIDNDIKMAKKRRVLTGITAGIGAAAVGLGTLYGGTAAKLAGATFAAIATALK